MLVDKFISSSHTIDSFQIAAKLKSREA